MSDPLAAPALEQIFLQARSIQTFTARPVTDEVLRRLYDLVKLTPTGFNAQPARFVFVRTAEGKERLAPALSSSNRPKMLAAPVTAIVAYDTRFFDRVHELFPRFDARGLFGNDPALAEQSAQKNSVLAAGFLIVAARALGLDAGPMSGYDAAEIDRRFFADGSWRTVLVVNLGYGDRQALAQRLPRLSFEDAATLV
jgi:3-hydroxypropanoate dehydrogenase